MYRNKEDILDAMYKALCHVYMGEEKNDFTAGEVTGILWFADYLLNKEEK